MENEWDSFWKSGKVEDYLKYCWQDKYFGGEDKGADRNDTVRDADGHGAFSNAVQ